MSKMVPEHDSSSKSLKRKRTANDEVKEKKDKKHKKSKLAPTEVEAAQPSPVEAQLGTVNGTAEKDRSKPKEKKKKSKKGDAADGAVGAQEQLPPIATSVTPSETVPITVNGSVEKDRSKSKEKKKKSKKGGDANGAVEAQEQSPAVAASAPLVPEEPKRKKSKKNKHVDTSVGDEKVEISPSQAEEVDTSHAQEAVVEDQKPEKKKKKKSSTSKKELRSDDKAEAKAMAAKADTSTVEQVTEEEPAGDTAAGTKQRFIVFIGNLPFTATTESVTEHFAKIRPDSVRHRTEKGSTKSRGFAFLEFSAYDRMRTCLKLYHHSSFEDGKSAPRRINVELTAGGGGAKSGDRKEKLKAKNEKLNEQRKRRAEHEEKEAAKKEEKERAKKGKDGGEEEKPKEVAAVGAGQGNQQELTMHPSRMAMINAHR